MTKDGSFQNCNVNNGNAVCSEILGLNCAGDLKKKHASFILHSIKNMVKGPDLHL